MFTIAFAIYRFFVVCSWRVRTWKQRAGSTKQHYDGLSVHPPNKKNPQHSRITIPSLRFDRRVSRTTVGVATGPPYPVNRAESHWRHGVSPGLGQDLQHRGHGWGGAEGRRHVATPGRGILPSSCTHGVCFFLALSVFRHPFHQVRFPIISRKRTQTLFNHIHVLPIKSRTENFPNMVMWMKPHVDERRSRKRQFWFAQKTQKHCQRLRRCLTMKVRESTLGMPYMNRTTVRVCMGGFVVPQEFLHEHNCTTASCKESWHVYFPRGKDAILLSLLALILAPCHGRRRTGGPKGLGPAFMQQGPIANLLVTESTRRSLVSDTFMLNLNLYLG